ncbi:MAG: AzlC family ABC transporter permease [Lachnospiraceae bacterium]|nr:AzlC family ABC transporter permease [Lachnospiraceae bacterium]
MSNKRWFLKGMRDGIPISTGYFAVSLTLGIAAGKAGISAWEATVMSFAMHASAGQFAAMELIAAGAGYLEMVLTEIVVNLRYVLMSCALSQKIRRDIPYAHRFFVAYDVTDEIFGISVSVEGKLNPFYTYGAMAVASPGWVGGTLLGALLGNIMPDRLLSAMNLALYGMFIAIVVPPARKNKILAGLVLVSLVAGGLFTWLPVLGSLSSGFRIMILTLVLAGGAAFLFPVEEEKEEETCET